MTDEQIKWLAEQLKWTRQGRNYFTDSSLVVVEKVASMNKLTMAGAWEILTSSPFNSLDAVVDYTGGHLWECILGAGPKSGFGSDPDPITAVTQAAIALYEAEQ